jgi:hypothetical protein
MSGKAKPREWILSPVGGAVIVSHRAGDALVTGLGGDESTSIRVLEAAPVEHELDRLRTALQRVSDGACGDPPLTLGELDDIAAGALE